MTSTLKDALLLLERMTGSCSDGTSEHNWRKCPRCMAIGLVQDGDPKALSLLRAVMVELQKR